MSKIIALQLGGEERTLDVGKFWFTKYYGEATGDDPINTTDIFIKPEKQFDALVNIVFAGMRCHAKVNKLPFTITKENVADWIGEKETTEITEIYNQYFEVTQVTGEEKPQDQEAH